VNLARLRALARGAWRQTRGASASTPLRVKLVTVMVGLVAIALVVIGAVSAVALRSHLVDRVDGQLADQIRLWAARVDSLSCEPQEIMLPSDYVIGISRSDCYAMGFATSTYAEGQVARPPGTVAEAVAVDRPYTASSPDHSRRWRMLTTVLSGGEVLTVGEDLGNVESALDRLVWVQLLVGTAVLIVVALTGAGLVRMSLRPLAEIEQTAVAIAGGDLTRRVPQRPPTTEVGRLSVALNAMLSQIEAAFRARAASEAQARRSEQRMRQFVADASHELRTPLTSIRGFAELYRQGGVTDPVGVVRRIEDEAARMGLLVEDLLLLARLDQERPLSIEPVHLVELVDDAAEAARVTAPDRPITIELGPAAGALVVAGDGARLRQVVGNLVTNALTHTPSGTAVALRLRADGTDYAVLEVADKGPGLTPEQADQVFERFYRVDKARTRQAAATGPKLAHSGAGLGLAIVAALVTAHHGDVEVDTGPGQGATFRVRLPLAPPAE
jgi:two-component system OmpR family sensor kinase